MPRDLIHKYWSFIYFFTIQHLNHYEISVIVLHHNISLMVPYICVSLLLSAMCFPIVVSGALLQWLREAVCVLIRRIMLCVVQF